MATPRSSDSDAASSGRPAPKIATDNRPIEPATRRQYTSSASKLGYRSPRTSISTPSMRSTNAWSGRGYRAAASPSAAITGSGEAGMMEETSSLARSSDRSCSSGEDVPSPMSSILRAKA